MAGSISKSGGLQVNGVVVTDISNKIDQINLTQDLAKQCPECAGIINDPNASIESRDAATNFIQERALQYGLTNAEMETLLYALPNDTFDNGTKYREGSNYEGKIGINLVGADRNIITGNKFMSILGEENAESLGYSHLYAKEFGEFSGNINATISDIYGVNNNFSSISYDNWIPSNAGSTILQSNNAYYNAATGNVTSGSNSFVNIIRGAQVGYTAYKGIHGLGEALKSVTGVVNATEESQNSDQNSETGKEGSAQKISTPATPPPNITPEPPGEEKNKEEKKSVEEILKPESKRVGKSVKGARSNIRTVSETEFKEIKDQLVKDAKPVDKIGYSGQWYELPDGSGFGIRNSGKNRLTYYGKKI